MNVPNLITLSRVPALFVVVALLFAPWPWAATLAFAVFVISAITDWLDGYIARRYGIISNFGKLMDALVDKILVVGVMVALLVPLPGGARLLPGWALFLVLLVLTREFLITGLRLMAASKGLVLAAERTGKIKTVLQLVSLSFLLLSRALEVDFGQARAAQWAQLAGLALFVAAAALTALSGAEYLSKYWDVFTGKDTDGKN